MQVRRLNINLSIFFLILIGCNFSKAVTLKSLAQKSALLLAVADNEDLQKKCKLTAMDISQHSQSLKAEIDTKIQSLTEKDFTILEGRTNTCQEDCTCSIYTLAYEARNKENMLMKQKAEKLTQADRLKCVQKYKNICLIIKN